jgi:hypothetical protein
MKNLFLSLAFLLIGSFAFVNSNEVLENSKVSDFVTANFDNLVTSDYVFSFNENQLSHSEFLALKDCTLRGKFTITFSDGSSYTWEGTLTIVGQSCAEFLKELMAD